MNGDTIQIEVPRSALVAAFLEKVARASAPQDFEMTDMQNRAALLPAVGGKVDGGIHAGITIHQGMPHALTLLPGEEKKDWKNAKAWAKQQDGDLPSRFDALVLFQNLKNDFKEEWYWCRDEYALLADYAWVQDFSNGSQYDNRKSYDSRCRAVRRVAI